MSDTVIQVEQLSKRYRIGVKEEVSNDTLVSVLGDMLRRPLKNLRQLRQLSRFEENDGKEAANVLWALKDVSFELKRGEVVGIIGKNGSGKSTLLKILSRITAPTTGRITLDGRIASLLEVGTGFHPELTGRENVFLNGTILGMRKKDVDRKFDEIVDFSGVEKFIDTPIKRYSSGMQVRLAFSVAIHLEPEILIVDEVLAVGDAEFQKKCIGRIESVAQGGGAVLMVSHNMAAVQALCNWGILLAQGQIVTSGTPSQIISRYLSSPNRTNLEVIWDNLSEAPGSDAVRLHAAHIRPSGGKIGDGITISTPIQVDFEYWLLKDSQNIDLSLQLLNSQGVTVLISSTVSNSKWGHRQGKKGLFRSTCIIPGGLLNDGSYSISLYIVKDVSNIAEYSSQDILSFEVADDPKMRGGTTGQWIGVVRPLLVWETAEMEV